MSFIRWSLVVFALLLLAACAGSPLAAAPTPEPSCAEQSAPFISQVQPLVQEWTDAATLAGQTPRVALAPQIDKLQEIRRRAQALEAPACAMPAKQHLDASMNASIKASLAFLGQQGDSRVVGLDAVAKDELVAFTAALTILQDPKAAPLPATKVYIDGLGVSREPFQTQFGKTYTFQERTLNTGEAALTGTNGDNIVELLGPATNIRAVTYNASLGRGANWKDVQNEAYTVLKLALPDWPDLDAWWNTVYKGANATTQTKVVNGRVVHIEEMSAINTLALSIEVP